MSQVASVLERSIADASERFVPSPVIAVRCERCRYGEAWCRVSTDEGRATTLCFACWRTECDRLRHAHGDARHLAHPTPLGMSPLRLHEGAGPYASKFDGFAARRRRAQIAARRLG